MTSHNDSENTPPKKKGKKVNKANYSDIIPSVEKSIEMIPRLFQANFVKICCLQIAGSILYAIELVVVIETIQCFNLNISKSLYVWIIPSAFGILLSPITRFLCRKTANNLFFQKLIIALVCLFQLVGISLLIFSKDLARLSIYTFDWKIVIESKSNAYLVSYLAMCTGFILNEICYGCIKSICLEMLYNRNSMTYEKRGLACFHITEGAGLIIGFSIGSYILDFQSCKFWMPPMVVVFVIYILSCAIAASSLKCSDEDDSELPLLIPSPTYNTLTTFSYVIPSSESFREFYKNYFKVVAQEYRNTKLFHLVYIMSWWSLFCFLYFFTHNESNLGKKNQEYLVQLIKHFEELRCTQTTTVLGLMVYASGFLVFCLLSNRLKAILSTVNIYCGALLMFALGMTMLATIPSCIQTLLIPLFPGILHATLTSATNLQEKSSDIEDQDLTKITYNNQVACEFSFFVAQFIWALSIGGIIAALNAPILGVYWASAIMASIAAILASRLCISSSR